ncbi:hypothetical protein SAMN05421749_101502 [Acinetobacter marinus]|uniref:Type IV secretion protein Rhs n=1 Tax=Acinetobacter marinus TaxID=281375 RepID=A0A1G6GWK6_9GAMM|nr:type IV secretion protein Rhs [Acinetobacter marinus]SDB86331.1 hypothetical protein SAMN05421749_101502 [Acinetobacter marinus]
MKIPQFSAKPWLILKRRALTVGEIALARSIFAEHLDYAKVEIVSHRLVLSHYAISPNGHIYFSPKDWRADFSKESLAIQSWLIHELTHVWQVQQGISVVKKALFDRRYRYVLQLGKSFLNYGIEQQAQMVQDYFLKSHRGEQCEDLRQCIPFFSAVTQNS